MKKKLTSTKNLHKKAWKLLSEYVRRKEKGICFTCYKIDNWKNCHAGHFIHGNNMDFVIDNIHCQCVRCNKWLHGNQIPYTIRMIETYGKSTVEHLQYLKHQTLKLSRTDLEQKISLFKSMLKELDEYLKSGKCGSEVRWEGVCNETKNT